MVIDPDQRGELIVALHNDSENTQTVTPNERIAQLIILPFAPIDEFVEVEAMAGTSRGDGGFGSTDE